MVSTDLRKAGLEVLEELAGRPAVPYYERAVAGHVRGLCGRAGLSVEADRYGNLLVTLPGSDAGAPGIAFVAHLDHPGFEVEPGTITLGEIQRRAAAFDPLELQIAPDVSAVSTNGWESLGSKGLALHLHWGKAAARSGRLSEILVLDTTRARTGGRRWRVLVDGKEMERFSRLEEAVEAVDYEVGRKGRAAAMSARPDAAWRAASVPSAVGKQLAELRPPRSASTHGEAVRYLAYAQHGPRGSAHPQRR